MTTFLRVLEETENKEAALLDAIQGKTGTGRKKYNADVDKFKSVKKSPFAYWISQDIRNLFMSTPKLEGNGRVAKVGLQTSEDFRFVRLWWEIPEIQFRKRWFPFAKGGKYSPYYDDIYLVVNWELGGQQIKSWIIHRYSYLNGKAEFVAKNPGYYFRLGLTWPRRTKSGLSMRPLNEGSVFADKGSGLFLKSNKNQDLLTCMAITMSKIFVYLIKVFLAAGDAKKGGAANSYEVGILQGIPFQEPNTTQSELLAALSLKSWTNRYKASMFKENGHAFIGPALLSVPGPTLSERVNAFGHHLKELSEEFELLQEKVNAICFDLYCVSAADRDLVLQSFNVQETPESESHPIDDDEDLAPEDDDAFFQNLPLTLAGNFISWSVGVALGRFLLSDRNLEKQILQLPGPFDPIPACSPGMQLKVELATPADCQLAIPSNGILVDDAGNPELDLVAQIRKVMEFIFEANADVWWQELCQALDPQGNDLRNWIRKDFFQQHLSQYSASRRKAPIYWPIATASKGYTLWLYSHRVTSDTLYRVVELVRLRKRDAELELTRLEDPSGADKRRARSDLELLMEELKELLAELERIQPLFHPNLDDGTVLVLAPLHRLFKAYPTWQKELADRWKDLVQGEYDWSSQAMRLWPDRVVRKCQTNRSLAIAHGLDDFFWQPTEGDKAVPKAVQESDILAEIKARTERSVHDALRSLLEAAPQTKAGARRAVTSTTREPRPAASRPQGAAVGRQRSSTFDLEEAAQQVLAFLQGREGQVAKNEILEGTGLPASQWNRVMESLTQQGLVEKTGDKRGSRYQVAPGQNRGEFP